MGSEMCIRDRYTDAPELGARGEGLLFQKLKVSVQLHMHQGHLPKRKVCGVLLHKHEAKVSARFLRASMAELHLDVVEEIDVP